MQPHTFNWLETMSPNSPAAEVKIEPEPSTAFHLRSISPSPPLSESSHHTGVHRRVNATEKRAKPYLRKGKHREPAEMHHYNEWSGNEDGRGHSERRSSSDGDQYGPPSAYVNRSFGSRGSGRPLSSRSGTSSLTGAMGNTHVSSRHSDSDSPTGDFFEMQTNLGWQGHHIPVAHPSFAGASTHHGHFPVGPIDGSHFQNYNYTQQTSYCNNPSPESLSPHSPAFPASSSYNGPSEFAYHHSSRSSEHRGSTSIHPTSYGSSSPVQSRPRTSVSTADTRESELRRQLAHHKQHIAHLETELTRSRAFPPAPPPAPSLSGTLSHSPEFQASWAARTDARVRMFCSLNRAGNALCAWHDSRRERRVYAPRLAPPGFLNCGCSYDEALFEESLARHDVGSYHPGENVRMDPALRNPLLKLLQTRYGYRDGDFERDSVTGEWTEGEGPAQWEARGTSNSARKAQK